MFYGLPVAQFVYEQLANFNQVVHGNETPFPSVAHGLTAAVLGKSRQLLFQLSLRSPTWTILRLQQHSQQPRVSLVSRLTCSPDASMRHLVGRYISLGALFMLIVRRRSEYYNRVQLQHQTDYLPDEAYGLPRQYGLFYAVVGSIT